MIDGSIAADGLTGRITVPLRARGALLGVAAFSRLDRPEAFTADDLILAEELAARAAVAIDNARRYTRERTTALTLQRSLLPQRLPEQAAVEVASRYLPAGTDAGVGGDWFDVIPLSGARVALVVGDVVGHGIHASATHGPAAHGGAHPRRRRPAAGRAAHPPRRPGHPPRQRRRARRRLPRPTGEVGRHLPVRRLRPGLAPLHAGQRRPPAAAVVSPDGTVGASDLPSRAAARHRRPALRGRRDRAARGQPARPLHRRPGRGPRPRHRPGDSPSCCAALRPPGRLAGRRSATRCWTPCCPTAPPTTSPCCSPAPRRCDADQVADLGPARRPRRGRRAPGSAPSTSWTAWGLEEAAFVTELVVSELVTNAIRYGEPPDPAAPHPRPTSLICEVSDASNTAPHLRRARAFDEGGRGLLLVAQLTQGWGTRHTTDGKTIWCAQTFTEPGSDEIRARRETRAPVGTKDHVKTAVRLRRTPWRVKPVRADRRAVVTGCLTWSCATALSRTWTMCRA